ncbi:putative phosphate/phosphoenolpyruvate translocator [Cryptosporidium canis]|uniref:Phosphate/phosphoenolpyruvate translocator n=1 Tax=Cryptosporidium canis TaxID=195482 RepID=A0A9D5DMH7_9CRYT|nr:putative phosphate/phosphoenolpyruvate translocator [Cryptosporidium canis]
MESEIKIEHGYGVRRKVESKHVVFLMWIFLSLIFTLYSKWLMSMYFPYPITMSLVHMVVASILSHVVGGLVGRQSGGKLRTWSIGELSFQEKRSILVFSMVVAVNIWFSNASLHTVSISLHQMARTTIPLFTMALGILFFKHKYRWMQILPVMLVIVGVAVTVNGTPELSVYGLSIVLLGCCVSSLKGILAQKLQVESLKINPIVMLQYVGPVASLALGLFSVIFGEADQILEQKESMDQVLLLTVGLLLVFAGIFAFLLNVLSFMSSSIVSPLAMNIAGNVKQLLTCLVGCFMFGNTVTDKLVFGILLTSLGALWYSMDKQKDFGRRKVRYVKGRYIDRAGLGIPDDDPARLQSKLSVSEAIEITQIGTFSKAPVIECPEEPELSDIETGYPNSQALQITPSLPLPEQEWERGQDQDQDQDPTSCCLKMDLSVQEEIQEIQVNLEFREIQANLETQKSQEFQESQASEPGTGPLKGTLGPARSMDFPAEGFGAKVPSVLDENMNSINI